MICFAAAPGRGRRVFSRMKKFPSGALKRPLLMPADRLSTIEFVDMMLPPRLHLDLLISGGPTEPDHLTSIAGVFNVATALAYLHRDARAIPFYESAGASLIDIARRGLPDDATVRRLIRAFNAAEADLAACGRLELLRAVQLVRQQIHSGQATPLLAA